MKFGQGTDVQLQRAEKSHYQSKVFVCVLNNPTDAVDRLLIFLAMSFGYSFPGRPFVIQSNPG